MAYLGWLFTGLLVGGSVVFLLTSRYGFARLWGGRPPIASLLRTHFDPVPLDDITISERQFPFRVRADLQRTLDRIVNEEAQVHHFCGVQREYRHEEATLSGCS